MWVNVTPADIQQAKKLLAARHAEILARHANEIQGLLAEEAQVERLAGLVEAFLRKFRVPAPVPADLAARSTERWRHRPATALEVAGFDRAVLPADPRLTPSGAVSIDFRRSRSGLGINGAAGKD